MITIKKSIDMRVERTWDPASSSQIYDVVIDDEVKGKVDTFIESQILCIAAFKDINEYRSTIGMKNYHFIDMRDACGMIREVDWGTNELTIDIVDRALDAGNMGSSYIDRDTIDDYALIIRGLFTLEAREGDENEHSRNVCRLLRLIGFDLIKMPYDCQNGQEVPFPRNSCIIEETTLGTPEVSDTNGIEEQGEK